jgi:hypothetical protein
VALKEVSFFVVIGGLVVVALLAVLSRFVG